MTISFDFSAARELLVMTGLMTGLVNGLVTELPRAISQGEGTANAQEAVPMEASEFVTDYVPTDCTTQFGKVERGDLPEKLAQDFTQAMDSAMVSQPAADCDAITATDNGETKNFNFIRANHGVYKVITTSDSSYDESLAVYVFEVLGVKFIPIDSEGQLDGAAAQTMRSLAGGTCEIDNLDAPYDVFCEFAATTGDEPDQLAIGQMSYLY